MFFPADASFGGQGVTNGKNIKTEDIPMHGCEQSVTLTLPGNTVFFLECTRKTPKPAPKEKAKATPKKAAAKKPVPKTGKSSGK